MQPRMIPSLAVVFLLSMLAHGEEAPDKNRNAVYVSPITMMVASGMLDFPIISIAYERSLSETGYSLFLPFHGGYLENEEEKDFALGIGLGIRKYLGHAFSGTYITGQTDYINSYNRHQSYDYKNSLPITVRKYDYLSITQLSLGYKWAWRQFTLDLNGGGALYAKDKDKSTNFIASANVGFPFNANTFGF